MDESTQTARIPPPWNHPDFLTEEALREAQEYYFQTHATTSRKIAEGRNAQGFMKGGLRRKLNKEMGEDFKMYTGSSIGDSDNANADSMGIRGELNALLENVFNKIAPGQPIISPAQEDLTILKHPQGALEVCFSLYYFYASLLKKYATLAGNRRKVLKSVLDEELFKWVWRMCIGFLVSEDVNRLDFDSRINTGGLAYIPLEQRSAATAEKILELGTFLLGKTMADSHLRFPLCYYFVTYLRQIHTQLLVNPNVAADSVYERIHNRDPNEGVGNVLLAIDILLNMHGNSMHSFDDVLKDQDRQIRNFIPDEEINFILQFQEFTDDNFDRSLQKFVPNAKEAAVEDNPAGSLMPLVLILRTMPYDTRARVLGRIPGPFLGMLGHRLTHARMDEPDKMLVDHIKEVAEIRRSKGESYTLVSKVKGKSQAPTTVKDGKQAQQPEGSTAGEGSSGSSAPAPAKERAAAASGGADTGTGAVAAAATVPQAESQPEAGADSLMNERLVLTWRANGQNLEVTSLAPREMLALTGPDPRFLKIWIMFALQSGQVFHIPHNQINKQVLEKLMQRLRDLSPEDGKAVLSEEKRTQLLKAGGKSLRKILTALSKAVPAERSAQAGALASDIGTLSEKLKDKLGDFLRNPSQDAFKPVIGSLSAQERTTVGVLQRVARLP